MSKMIFHDCIYQPWTKCSAQLKLDGIVMPAQPPPIKGEGTEEMKSMRRRKERQGEEGEGGRRRKRKRKRR